MRNSIVTQFQILPTNYKGRKSKFILKKSNRYQLNQVIRANITNNGTDSVCLLIWYDTIHQEDNITCGFPAKNHNLNRILRKYQTSKLRNISQNNYCVIFKMSISWRQRTSFQIKGDQKGMVTKCTAGDHITSQTKRNTGYYSDNWRKTNVDCLVMIFY